jgi:toxin ParE1/3/4
MRVRWTEAAAEDLARIVQYIAEDNPEAARRVAQTIFDGVAALAAFPARGRIGLTENTRDYCFRRGPISPSMKLSATKCMCFGFAMPPGIGRRC